MEFGVNSLTLDLDAKILESSTLIKNWGKIISVTTCNRAEVALNFLRDHKNGCDIVISDVHMPDMDGFKLLECVGLEMDLPVISECANLSATFLLWLCFVSWVVASVVLTFGWFS